MILGDNIMAVTYEKLWKLLQEKNRDAAKSRNQGQYSCPDGKKRIYFNGERGKDMQSIALLHR